MRLGAMRLWCRHQWVVEHPFNYRANVRGLMCEKCGAWHDHNVLGEYGVLPFYFDAQTLRPLSGYRGKELKEWRRRHDHLC